eukprot:g1620.t1
MFTVYNDFKGRPKPTGTPPRPKKKSSTQRKRALTTKETRRKPFDALPTNHGNSSRSENMKLKHTDRISSARDWHRSQDKRNCVVSNKTQRSCEMSTSVSPARKQRGIKDFSNFKSSRLRLNNDVENRSTFLNANSSKLDMDKNKATDVKNFCIDPDIFARSCSVFSSSSQSSQDTDDGKTENIKLEKLENSNPKQLIRDASCGDSIRVEIMELSDSSDEENLNSNSTAPPLPRSSTNLPPVRAAPRSPTRKSQVSTIPNISKFSNNVVEQYQAEIKALLLQNQNLRSELQSARVAHRKASAQAQEYKIAATTAQAKAASMAVQNLRSNSLSTSKNYSTNFDQTMNKNEANLLFQKDKKLSTVEKKNTSKPVVASSGIYSVGNFNRVRRNRLGRTASVCTRQIIEKAEERELQNRTQIETEAERVCNYVESRSNAIYPHMSEKSREGINKYAKSQLFLDDLRKIASAAGQIFAKESRVLELSSPLYVFGDLHGNLDDLHFFSENLWTFGMGLTAGSFVCLGDYVDRGFYGLEVAGYLLAQKVLRPNKIFMLRGNHETRAVNGWESHYGNGSFKTQCRCRFGNTLGTELWEDINQCFDFMPLAAVVDKSVFCVHGGIPRPLRISNAKCTEKSPEKNLTFTFSGCIDAINRLPHRMLISERYPTTSPEQQRMAMDVVWADPASSKQEMSGKMDSNGFGDSERGGGVSCYGTKAVEKFLDANGLSYIIRAHTATAEGIAVSKASKVFTVFSTSQNHGCGENATCGCILIDSGMLKPIHREPNNSASSHEPK